MRSSRLNRVALVGAAVLLTACMSTGAPVSGRGSSPRVAAALRPVLTTTFRPSGGVYGITTGAGFAWATSGGSLYRINPVTDRSESILSLATASLSTLAYGAGSLWVTDNSGILRVDPATGKLTGTVPIVVTGTMPIGSSGSLSFGDGALWTLDRAGMVRIDPRTMAVRTLPLPFEKRVGFAVGEGAAWMSVVNEQCLSGCLLRLSLSSGRVVARVRGADLFGLVATGDGAVWVSNGYAVVRINPRTNRVVKTIELLASPGSGELPIIYGSGLMAAAPRTLWVTTTLNGANAHLVQIDTVSDSVVGRPIAVGAEPGAITAEGRTVWLASGQTTLTRMDLVACRQRVCRAPAPPVSEPASGTPLWFQSVQMVSPRIGWALHWTENPGVIDASALVPARTTDGGRTWIDVRPPGVRVSPYTGGDLFALGTERAWLTIGTTLYSTSDGGASWVRLSTIEDLGVIDFINARDGWIMQQFGAASGQDVIAILRTTDGGRRWSLVARTPSLVGSGVGTGGLTTGCDKSGIVFVSRSEGWLTEYCNGGSLRFLTTHDGGLSWAEQSLPASAAACSYGCGANPPRFFGSTGFLTLTGGGLLVTHDSGATWSVVRLPARLRSPWTIQFVDARHGFLVPAGRSGAPGQVLYVTSDSGVKWTPVQSNIEFNQYGTFDFVSSEAGIIWIQAGDVLGLSPLYRTSDGGRTWARFTPTLTSAARRA
ncbi:MAG: hypothetical protein ABSD85_14370 [Acidimicrobiales bacterium]|jgi:photosystem II stability/assembly factor-like uncharacterized protein